MKNALVNRTRQGIGAPPLVKPPLEARPEHIILLSEYW